MENLCRGMHGPPSRSNGAKVTNDDSESENQKILDHCVILLRECFQWSFLCYKDTTILVLRQVFSKNFSKRLEHPNQDTTGNLPQTFSKTLWKSLRKGTKSPKKRDTRLLPIGLYVRFYILLQWRFSLSHCRYFGYSCLPYFFFPSTCRFSQIQIYSILRGLASSFGKPRVKNLFKSRARMYTSPYSIVSRKILLKLYRKSNRINRTGVF